MLRIALLRVALRRAVAALAWRTVSDEEVQVSDLSAESHRCRLIDSRLLRVLWRPALVVVALRRHCESSDEIGFCQELSVRVVSAPLEVQLDRSAIARIPGIENLQRQNIASASDSSDGNSDCDDKTRGAARRRTKRRDEGNSEESR